MASRRQHAACNLDGARQQHEAVEQIGPTGQFTLPVGTRLVAVGLVKRMLRSDVNEPHGVNVDDRPVVQHVLSFAKTCVSMLRPW
jgi:hypothetical protein